MRPPTAFIVLSSSLAACGMSDEDIRKAWGATNTALTGGQSQSAGGLTADQAGTTFEYACAGGGAATFSGEAVTENEFSFHVVFAGCSAQEVTIDGSLDFATVTSSTSSSFSMTFDYTGSLTWSGDVEGECDIDMTGSLTASEAGSGGSFTGTICGEDAGEVF